MMYHEYTDLCENIRAPKELKAKVLETAIKQGSKHREKVRAGRYSRGWSFVQKAAVAAILFIVLPVTAYAAVKGLGLTDYLAERGMQDIEAVEQLSNTPTESGSSDSETSDDVQGLAFCSTSHAEFTLLEAVCDSETIYLAAKAEPAADSYFLIPQYLEGDYSVEYLLGMEGLDEGTINEYAASQGKTLMVAGVGYEVDGSILTGGEDYRYDENGNLYYYFSAHNSSGSKDISMKFKGRSYAPEASFEEIERVECETKLIDKSTAIAQLVYTTFDPNVFSDTGIQINSLTFEETEMGMYATFNFTTTEAKFTEIDFRIVDASGKELAYLPLEIGSGTIDNGDGSFSRTTNYQKPASMDGLQFIIRDLNNTVNYGPYTFE